jgi:hypothetical protein
MQRRPTSKPGLAGDNYSVADVLWSTPFRPVDVAVFKGMEPGPSRWTWAHVRSSTVMVGGMVMLALLTPTLEHVKPAQKL